MPDFKLTQEEVIRLRNMTPDFASVEDTLRRLEAIGIPTDEHRERFEMAKKYRDGFLQQFAPTGVPSRDAR